MTLPRKGTRSIVVDGVSYRWIVAPNDEPGLAIVVEREGVHAQRLVRWVDHGTIVSPRLVRAAILEGLEAGWHPAAPGRDMVRRGALPEAQAGALPQRPCRICGWSVDVEGDLCSECLKRERERLDKAARRRAIPDFEPPGPRWENPEPLWITFRKTGGPAVEMLDRAAFPEVIDLEIRHHGLLDEGYVYFASPTLGWLGGFTWYSTLGQDLVTEGSRCVPRGSEEHPWHDLDQGWEMVLWEHDGYIHVAQGHGDQGGGGWGDARRAFHGWFRVPLHLYVERFEALIERLRRDGLP